MYENADPKKFIELLINAWEVRPNCNDCPLYNSNVIEDDKFGENGCICDIIKRYNRKT